jgi:aminoglycoside 6'-N-acetyltransferase I
MILKSGGSPMVTIREMTAADTEGWATMRALMWPDESVKQHATWIDGFLRGGDWGFIAESASGNAAGFAEVALRKYANGCETAPVPFLEAIWVATSYRRQGVARLMLRHIEMFLAGRAFRELGSDALLENVVSHAAHRAWGFEETERVLYFRKSLGG